MRELRFTQNTIIDMIDNNKINGVLEFLRENAYTYYRSGEERPLRDWQDKLYLALLHSLSMDELIDLKEKMDLDGAPATLYYKAKGVLKSKEREQRGELSTDTLIAWYQDKKSGKVSVACKELMSRFPTESVESQQEILNTFLSGGKKEVGWAGRRLRVHWFESLSVAVAESWRRTHNPSLAYAILRHMPESFILAEQEELVESTKYAYVCARLVNEAGFHMDQSRLSSPDLLYVLAKQYPGVSSNDEVTSVAEKFLRDYLKTEDTIPSDSIGLILWSLGRLGMTDTILRIKAELEKLDKAEQVDYLISMMP